MIGASFCDEFLSCFNPATFELIESLFSLANFALGSASELEYQIFLAKELDFLSEQIFKELTNQVIEIKRMLTSLHQKVLSDSR